MVKKKIAIIGGGVSGLSAAYFLEEADHIDITLFEKGTKVGGNAITINSLLPDGKNIPVDPVVYLFLKPRYPFFTTWLESLNIDKISLSFENYLWNDQNKRGTLVTSNLKKILSLSTKSLTYFSNLFMFKLIINKAAELEKKKQLNDELLMKDFLAMIPFISRKFVEQMFYPLLSFAFHTDISSMDNMPCGTNLRAYLMASKDPSAIYCIKDGVQQYVKKVYSQLTKTKVKLNTQVLRLCQVNANLPTQDSVVNLNQDSIVNPNQDSIKWQIRCSDNTCEEFDSVILALWPHQAARLLEGNTSKALSADSNLKRSKSDIAAVVETLQSIETVTCRATVHTDASIMPEDKKNWVNYAYKLMSWMTTPFATIWSGQPYNASIFTSYDWSMHKDGTSEQNEQIKIQEPIFDINIHYRTPPRLALYQARRKIEMVQGNNNLWFTGSYLRETGYHEDGLVSSLELIKKLFPDYRTLPRMDQLLQNTEKTFGKE